MKVGNFQPILLGILSLIFTEDRKHGFMTRRHEYERCNFYGLLYSDEARGNDENELPELRAKRKTCAANHAQVLAKTYGFGDARP